MVVLGDSRREGFSLPVPDLSFYSDHFIFFFFFFFVIVNHMLSLAISNFYFKIHITILTCEYHNSTKPNLRKGVSKNQPPKYPNLVIGIWAISR